MKFLFTNVSADDLAGYDSVENLETVLPDNVQLGQLAGVVAGLMTSTSKIGFVAGMELSSSKEKYEAYLAAAKKVNASVEGFVDYWRATPSPRRAAPSPPRSSPETAFTSYGETLCGRERRAQCARGGGRRLPFQHRAAHGRLGPNQPTVIASTVVDWMIGQAMDRIESGEYGRGHVIEATFRTAASL